MILKKAYVNKANENVAVVQFYEWELLELKNMLVAAIEGRIKSEYWTLKQAIDIVEKLKKVRPICEEKWKHQGHVK